MFRTLKYVATPVMIGTLISPHVVYASMEGKCKNPACVYDSPPPPKCAATRDPCRETELERCIAKCRTELGPIQTGFQEYSTLAMNFFSDTCVTVGENVDYLRECAPKEVQVGAIVAGSLFGALLGFRRGMFRKLFYGAIGGAATASVIYPCEAKIVAKEGFEEVKKYGLIAYNFAVGSQPTNNCKPKKKRAE